MAAPGPPATRAAAAPIVPTAVPPTVYYRGFFADAANDPFNGHYAAALQPYLITGHGVPAPQQIRNIVANARTQNVPTAFVLQHEDDKKLHIYLQLDRMEPRMGLPATTWDNNIYALKGELRFNHHQTVHFDNDNFNQTNVL